ncbi:hypothetical protein RB195_001137 [Necator americanus]|uniref:PX domain-containing protein n=1 Tax=Necator americanus TaxID=51031 RepID=A0ABR1DCU5_NECAM
MDAEPTRLGIQAVSLGKETRPGNLCLTERHRRPETTPHLAPLFQQEAAHCSLPWCPAPMYLVYGILRCRSAIPVGRREIADLKSAVRFEFNICNFQFFSASGIPGPEMALLDIESISPQMDNNFNAKILNYKIVDDGKFALYTIQLTVDSYTWTVERRYSEFDVMDMRRFPDRKKSFLPPKRLIRNLDSEFLEERRTELEKYCRALLELEVWYQKQKKVNSLPLLTAKFFDFHQYEIHSIVDDLSVRLGGVGEEWLTNSESSPKYFEFTPIEMHAITKRLRLPEPTAPDPRMVADLGNTIDFLHRVRALKVRGAKGYVGTSNIVWNSLSYSLHFCKSLLALWISDSDVSRVCGLGSVRRTLRRLVIHYSMNNLRDLLLEDEPLLPVTELEPWACLEEADFSFNELKSIDESVRVLGGVQKLNFSHNNVTDIGPYLQHLTCLTELDLSSNGISSVQQWNEVLGNVKKIILANNAIKDVTGLSRLYSLEFLDLRNNAIDTVPSVYPLGGLPCLEVLHLRGNPVRKVVEYRTRVLEAFAERSCEVKLDGRAPDDREKDTIRLRLALRRAKEEKEEKERKRREKIEEKIRYISGDVCAFSDEVESS